MKGIVEMTLLLLIAALMAVAAVHATSFRGGGSWFPVLMSTGGAALASTLAVSRSVSLWRGRSRQPFRQARPPQPATGLEMTRGVYWYLWILLWPTVVFLLGLYVGTAIWISVFLKVNSQATTWTVAVSVLGVCITFVALTQFLNLSPPSSLIGSRWPGWETMWTG